MKKYIILFLTFLLIHTPSDSKMINNVWHNDLRTLFLKNQAIIYTINIRTFNANDTNGNEIIDEDEEKGNFVNAVQRLDELVKCGINTIHVLPITPTGKLKAFGTAGSLYAISDFASINPQLCDEKSLLSNEEQAKLFIKECHKRNIRVIIDLPACGSYDLFLSHPELFIKNSLGQPVIPLDWKDVRALNPGNEQKINEEVYGQYKFFVDMILRLGADGIRADVATMKTGLFWKTLINYTRSKNPEFMFLAEASNLWMTPPCKECAFTSYDKLLEAGFDGYYGDFFNLKNQKTSKDFFNSVFFAMKMQDNGKKSVIGSFTTHDEVSPILVRGKEFSKMIIWLNTTLPLNSYYIDGFQTGDDYDYCWANKKAEKTYTDNDYYFNHSGQIDIFNFSRKPGGCNNDIYSEFLLANKFKEYYAKDLTSMTFKRLRTSADTIFAYMRSNSKIKIVVVGNLDFGNSYQVTVKGAGVSDKNKYKNLRINTAISPVIKSGKIITKLEPGEIQVLLFKGINK